MGRLKELRQAQAGNPTKVVESPKPVEVVEVKPQPEAKEVKKEDAKPEVKKPEPIRVKEVGGRRWWLVYCGLGGAVLGFGGFYLFMGNQNTFIGISSVGLILGGFFAIYYGLKVQEGGLEVITPAGKKKDKKEELKANSLNLYPGRVVFEELPDDQLKGIPQKCLNDNKFYYVHIWDSAWKAPRPEGKLIEFKLPDTQYRDPREFALNLEIPAHRRLAQRKATLLEKVSPWILIVAIVIVGIIMIASAPASPGG